MFEQPHEWVPLLILSLVPMLDALDPARVTMQVSLDSGTPALDDRHRGAGSFERAQGGIALLRELRFRVRVAATVDAADAAEERGFHALLDAEGTPLGIAEPAIQVASDPL